MRQLPADLDGGLSNPSQAPIWLLKLQGAFGTFSLCSHTPLSSFAEESWEQANFTVKGPDARAGGGVTASVDVTHHDALITAFLTQSWTDTSALLYFTYYRGNDLVDPVLLLSGEVSGMTLKGKQIGLQLTAGGNRSGVTPWIRIAPPTFNWLTARGTVLTWGVDKIVLDKGQ